MASARAILDYSGRPGAAAHAPKSWPSQSRIRPEAGKATLVMLAHPFCPCTRASIGELARLMSRIGGRLEAHVLFLQQSELGPGQTSSELWRSASHIPGVSVLPDQDGREAALFGASTSGQVVVYGPDGALLFSGGITSARGHQGDNAGESRIAALVLEGQAERSDSLVYGCPL